MPLEKTHSDSIREYLTGAASNGGPQVNPANSLGNFRSSTEAKGLSIAVANPINNLLVLYAGGGNVPGDGTLTVVDANHVTWACNGGTPGPIVKILTGQTKIIETAGIPSAYIRVTRTTATALKGTATITLAVPIDNVFALDDVTSVEAAAGDTEYRATIIVNESNAPIANFRRWLGTLGIAQVSGGGQLGAAGAGTIILGTGTFMDWPRSGWVRVETAGGTLREIAYYPSRTDTTLTVPAAGRGRLGTVAGAGAATDVLNAVPGIALALEPGGVTAGGLAVQTVANENTAPAGVAWNTGITAATGLVIGGMAAGRQIGMWVKREISAGAMGTTDAEVTIQESFDGGA